MTLPVFWAPDVAALAVGDRGELTGEEARHAVVVRRVRVGEQVVLTDGAGSSVAGEVLETGRDSLSVRVLETARVEREQPRLTVVQAIPKGEYGEIAVRMLTEVGVDAIVPWAASRCVAVWRGERGTRSARKWRDAAAAAAKQARRTWFPEVPEQVSTDEAADLVRGADLALVLHEGARRPLADLAVPATGRAVLVVGPEGGVGEDELAVLVDAGAVPVRLGSTVLRSSTAGAVACGALLSRTPRWS